MPYFLPLQIKNIESNLSKITDRTKKIEYLTIEKGIAETEIKCLTVILNNPNSFRKKLKKNCEDVLYNIYVYKTFLLEKMKYRYSKLILLIFGDLIEKAGIYRYIWIMRKEKRKFIELIIEKERQIESEKIINERQLEIFQNEIFVEEEDYFEGPGKKELETIKPNTFLKLEDLSKGYKRIHQIISEMKDKDKVITLNEARNDINKIIYGLEIDINILRNFKDNYRLIKKEHPEIIHLIMREERLIKAERRSKVGRIVATVDEIVKRIGELKKFYIKMIDRIGEDLQLIESKRMIKAASKKKQPEQSKKSVIWLGTKEQLLTLFFLLDKNGFITFYDVEVILGHFAIIAADGKSEKHKTMLPDSKFLWLGADDDFAQLINELVENKLTPDGHKYKKFSEHFLNRNDEHFKHLPQKNYFANNFLNANKKITEIVSQVITLQ